ncbi:SUF system Fe-S cluster assembly regulator [Methylogaea oryzae]|uniref:Transcriptional regulator n=1 Tax=Methylogaea oryzae TaxID=1295382 RepID=A0A8D4VRF8_9GAMM|nr:SUF system Fe-S cluster assembly regulator [Methylogaea oryzae]BBL71934.1 transcriptional regulator [Methylogaea oryzae]
MIRISKLTDYAFIVLGHMARGRAEVYAAAELADGTGIAMPTVSKVLKSLTRAGVVRSSRGAHGGYALSRPAEETSVATVIYALEGPIAITECGVDDHRCNQSDSCHAQGNWSVINRAIRNALESVSLAELSRPVAAEEISIPLHRVARRRPAELAE